MGQALFFFYLAGVADSLDTWAGASAVVLIVGLGIASFVGTVLATVDNELAILHGVRDHYKKVVIAIISCALISALMPTKQFLYVAAGLAAGEVALDTEIAQKAYDALNQQLDELLGNE